MKNNKKSVKNTSSKIEKVENDFDLDNEEFDLYDTLSINDEDDILNDNYSSSPTAVGNWAQMWAQRKNEEENNNNTEIKNSNSEINSDIEINNDNIEIENNDTEIDNNNIEIENNDTEIENNDIEIKNNDTEIKNNDTEIENNDIEIENNDIEIENNDIKINNNDIEIKNNNIKIDNNVEIDNTETDKLQKISEDDIEAKMSSIFSNVVFSNKIKKEENIENILNKNIINENINNKLNIDDNSLPIEITEIINNSINGFDKDIINNNLEKLGNFNYQSIIDALENYNFQDANIALNKYIQYKKQEIYKVNNFLTKYNLDYFNDNLRDNLDNDINNFKQNNRYSENDAPQFEIENAIDNTILNKYLMMWEQAIEKNPFIVTQLLKEEHIKNFDFNNIDQDYLNLWRKAVSLAPCIVNELKNDNFFIPKNLINSSNLDEIKKLHFELWQTAIEAETKLKPFNMNLGVDINQLDPKTVSAEQYLQLYKKRIETISDTSYDKDDINYQKMNFLDNFKFEVIKDLPNAKQEYISLHLNYINNYDYHFKNRNCDKFPLELIDNKIFKEFSAIETKFIKEKEKIKEIYDKYFQQYPEIIEKCYPFLDTDKKFNEFYYQEQFKRFKNKLNYVNTLKENQNQNNIYIPNKLNEIFDNKYKLYKNEENNSIFKFINFKYFDKLKNLLKKVIDFCKLGILINNKEKIYQNKKDISEDLNNSNLKELLNSTEYQIVQNNLNNFINKEISLNQQYFTDNTKYDSKEARQIKNNIYNNYEIEFIVENTINKNNLDFFIFKHIDKNNCENNNFNDDYFEFVKNISKQNYILNYIDFSILMGKTLNENDNFKQNIENIIIDNVKSFYKNLENKYKDYNYFIKIDKKFELNNFNSFIDKQESYKEKTLTEKTNNLLQNMLLSDIWLNNKIETINKDIPPIYKNSNLNEKLDQIFINYGNNDNLIKTQTLIEFVNKNCITIKDYIEFKEVLNNFINNTKSNFNIDLNLEANHYLNNMNKIIDYKLENGGNLLEINKKLFNINDKSIINENLKTQNVSNNIKENSNNETFTFKI